MHMRVIRIMQNFLFAFIVDKTINFSDENSLSHAKLEETNQLIILIGKTK